MSDTKIYDKATIIFKTDKFEAEMKCTDIHFDYSDEVMFLGRVVKQENGTFKIEGFVDKIEIKDKK